MELAEILALAGSVSILSGWRLYLTIFVTGLAMRLGWIDLPQHLDALDALASPWVLGLSALGAVAEFFADKIAWLDSIWDALHSLLRPLGGALLALAIVDASDPVWQVVLFLLGGGAALAGHGAKATSRAAINTSPEPFSNVVMSTGEDVTAGGLLILALANPLLALAVSLFLMIAMIALLLWGWRKLKGKDARKRRNPSHGSS